MGSARVRWRPCTQVGRDRSDVVRPQAQHGEGPAVFTQQQADLVVVRVGVQRLVVLLVLHLVLRGVSARCTLTGLRGARLRRAFLPPLGAPVLEPHLQRSGASYHKIHVPDSCAIKYLLC